MSSIKLYAVALAILILLPSSLLRADVSKVLIVDLPEYLIKEGKTKSCCLIDITGEIKKSDITALKAAINEYEVLSGPAGKVFYLLENVNNSVDFDDIYIHDLTFRLMSKGGDVQAAIDMGRILRAYNATVVVPDFATCASACVLAYAGGTFRIAMNNPNPEIKYQEEKISNLYIHRPYSTITGERTVAEITNERSRIKSLIESYLKEVNVSTQLYELMDAIPSDESRPLSHSELKLLKLGIHDPVYKEQIDARIAGELGVSRQHYYKMKGYCGDNFTYHSEEWKNCFR